MANPSGEGSEPRPAAESSADVPSDVSRRGRDGRRMHENSLRNLRPNPDKLVPNAHAWKPGAMPALRSGWRTRNPAPTILGPVVAELVAELGEGAPVRDEHGEVPAHDRAAVETAAIDVLIVRRVHAFLELNGWADPETGRMRPEVEHLGKATGRLAGKLAQLGMTPISRSRLGLNLTRTFDLAQHWQAEADAAAEEGE